MARFSVSFCKSQLEKYVAAETAVLGSQSYTIGGRSLSRAQLSEIRKGIEYWGAKLADAERAEVTGRNGIIMKRSIPHG